MWRIVLSALFLAFTQSACETTSRSVSLLRDFDVTHAAATRAWIVIDKGEPVGEMVRYDDENGERFFYSVRNPFHQELGFIDSVGRAYRFRAHQPEPSWTGTGAVIEGVRSILEASLESELREVELAQLAGSEAPAASLK